MSGIVGIVQRDGTSVEEELLLDLTRFLSFRGPNGQHVWRHGPVGIGHSELRTGLESRFKQPANLGNRFWITADARMDCRDELLDDLESAGLKCPLPASHSELILYAYANWGEMCVEHLRGDFAFAIWDTASEKLFCARDHFGIKPFYYAHLDDVFVFSNTLNCLRLHPAVSSQLNESAIADFLLFGLNYDLATTTFRDIDRLPAAHCLSLSSAGLRVQRYWSPPTNGRIRYARANEYIEHFDSIFKCAVADRVQTGRAGILLSGGLDSGAVASVASEISQKEPLALQAYTVTFPSLARDQEGTFSQKTADFLRIPIQFLPFDHTKIFDRWDDPELGPPEPGQAPFFVQRSSQSRTIAENCRVVLSGEGSDNLMEFQMWPYLKSLWSDRKKGAFFCEASHYLWIRPFPWRGIRYRLRRLLQSTRGMSPVAAWISPDFARRTNLAERWQHFAAPSPQSTHPILPLAHASLGLPQWSHLFESEDPGGTCAPVEVRYPFLDLRIVNFLLALPPFPWFFEKKLLRQAMVGRLPESVRLREKTPLQGDPAAEWSGTKGSELLNHVKWDPQITRFVDVSRLATAAHDKNDSSAEVNIRPHCLNFWLRSAMRVRYNLVCAEGRNG